MSTYDDFYDDIASIVIKEESEEVVEKDPSIINWDKVRYIKTIDIWEVSELTSHIHSLFSLGFVFKIKQIKGKRQYYNGLDPKPRFQILVYEE